MRIVISLLLLAFLLPLSAQRTAFDSQQRPAPPDYSQEKYWAALPFRGDMADLVPQGLETVNDSMKEVDVFFIHPTTYGEGENWNADLNDVKVNTKTDEKPILYQASVFNEVARVYAPRYRQAIYASFVNMEGDGARALEFAYTDVRAAFEYYLTHYNQGRPIIIASHSQGTWHARKLLREFFDGKPLQQKLVAAYIVGYAVPRDWFQQLKACNDTTQTGCILAWASYLKGYEPTGNFYRNAICVNPVSWQTDTLHADRGSSMGSMLFNFNKRLNNACGAQIHDNYLWVDTRLGLVRSRKNLHVGDYNLFWYDIRWDVKRRVRMFWKK